MIHKNEDGSYTVTNDAGVETIIPADAEDLHEQINTARGPDLSLPDVIPMDRVEMFLAATKQLPRVESYIKSLGPVAEAQFRRAREFVPTSPFGQVLRAALLPPSDTPEADYALLCRSMEAHTVDDYGSPKPSLLQAIAKFFFGG